MNIENLDQVFVICAFTFILVLIVHFTIRRWRFSITLRYGWIVYALSIPAAAVSVLLLLGGKAWYFWLAGFLYLIWAIFGYIVEYRMKIEWRNALRWPILIPYVFLYLATTMFYWWPLIRIQKELWVVYTVLYIICTVLNITSHKTSATPKKVLRA